MVDNIILINSHTNTLASSTMGANSGVGITLSSFLKHLGSVLLGRVLTTTVLDIVLFLLVVVLSVLFQFMASFGICKLFLK